MLLHPCWPHLQKSVGSSAKARAELALSNLFMRQTHDLQCSRGTFSTTCNSKDQARCFIYFIQKVEHYIIKAAPTHLTHSPGLLPCFPHRGLLCWRRREQTGSSRADPELRLPQEAHEDKAHPSFKSHTLILCKCKGTCRGFSPSSDPATRLPLPVIMDENNYKTKSFMETIDTITLFCVRQENQLF